MFGKTLKGAEIRQGILFTIHQTNSMDHEFRFYNLSAVRQHQKVRYTKVFFTKLFYRFAIFFFLHM